VKNYMTSEHNVLVIIIIIIIIINIIIMSSEGLSFVSVRLLSRCIWSFRPFLGRPMFLFLLVYTVVLGFLVCVYSMQVL
jgi:hypothetical protein